MGDVSCGHDVGALRNEPAKLFNALTTTYGAGPIIGQGFGRFHL